MYQQISKTVKLLLALILLLWNTAALSQVNAGTDKSVCTSVTTLNANPSGGVWTTSGGAIIVSPSSQLTSVNNLDPGANTFTYTVGGLGNDDIVVTNNQVTANAGNDITACSSSASLNGSAIPSGGSGEWSLIFATAGVTIDNTASASTDVHGLPFGSTTLVWTVSANGCNDSDEINITNNIANNNSGSNQSGCTSIFYIGASTPPSGGTGIWSNISGTGVAFDNINNPGVQITSPIGSSTVRWTITYQSCPSSKDFIVTNNLPNPNAGKDTSICIDDITLYANALLPGETGAWSVIGPQAEVFSNTTNPTSAVSNIKQGTTTFEWKITNALCSASDQMKITNNRPDVDAGPDAVICTSNYTFNANNPTPESGFWTCSDPTVTFNNSNLYNATASNLENDVYTFTWEVSNGTCSATDDVVITSDYVSITAGNDINSCSNTFSLSGTPIPLGASGYWALTYGDGTIDNSLAANTTARNISEISNFRWTIISGACTYNDEIQVTNLLPSQAVTNADKAVCSNQTVITASPPVGQNEAGVWSVEGGSSAIIQSPSLFQTQVTNLNSGSNLFRWTIYNSNCSTSDLIEVTNNQITTYAGADQILCSTSTNLAATLAGGSGYWTCTNPSVVITNSTLPNSSVANLAFGTNTFTWTRNDLGCTTSDEVLIINNLPEGVFAGNDQVVCQDQASLAAAAPTNGTGNWTVVSGGGTFVNSTLYQTQVNNISLGLNIYRWTVTYGTCLSFDEVEISDNRIVVSAGNDTPVCNQLITNLLATEPTGGQTGQWTVIGGNGVFANNTVFNTTVSNLIKGINTYRWTLSDAYCTNYDEITITNNTPDSAKVGANKIICTDNVEINAVAVTNGTGSWSVTSGSGIFDQSNNNNTFARSIGSGSNTFTWTVTKNNCSLSANLVVTNSAVNAEIVADQISICEASHSTTIEATAPTEPGAAGVWTKLSVGSGTIQSPSNYQTVLTGLANGNNRFQWTVQNANCSSFDEITVTNNYYTATANAVGSPAVCLNYIGIIGNAPPSSGSGAWSNNSSLVTYDNLASSNTFARNLPVGTTNITWTISKDGCNASTNFNVTNNSITVSAGNDIVGCSTAQSLNADNLTGSQSGYWTADNVSVIFANSTNPKTTTSNIPMGTSQLTWTITENGCFASDDMVLINNSFSVTAGSNQTICSTTYSISGSDPITGTGNWTLIQGTGSITNPASKTTAITSLGNGANIFRWTVTMNSCVASDDVSITNDLYVAQASAPSAVCIDEVVVTAQTLPSGSGATGVWTTLFGGGVFDNANAYTTTVRDLSIGSNRFRWTVTKGSCQSYINIDVSDNRIDVSAGVDQEICDNYSDLFASPLSATATGLWTCNIGSVNIATPANASTNVTNLSRGDNVFTWTVNDKGCTGENSVTVTNNSFDAYAGIDQEIIVDNTAMGASLPVGASGEWSVVTGNASFTADTNPVSSVTNIAYGINTYRWTVNSNGCYEYDDVQVIYNVAESYAGEDQVSCKDYAVMNADLPEMGTGVWTIVQGGGTFQNPAQYNTTVTNIPRGTNIYRWTVTAYQISESDDVSVTNNSFDIYAGEDQQTCNSSVNLNGENAGSGTGSWYILQGSGSFSDNADSASSVEYLFVGDNSYIWQVTRNSCVARDTVKITRYQGVTTAIAGPDAQICDDNKYNLSANNPTNGTGTWSSSNSDIIFDLPNQFTTLVHNLPNGPSTLFWTISNSNCQSQDTVIISSWNTVTLDKEPDHVQMDEGAMASFSVETTGNVELFQWQKDGVDLINDGRINGANSAILSISNLAMTDQGYYQCMINGYCNYIESQIVSLSVISGIEDLHQSGIKLYPNPSNGIINLDFDDLSNIKSVEIYHLNGKRVLQKQQLSRKETFDLTNQSDGTYLIVIQKDNRRIESKFIIRK